MPGVSATIFMSVGGAGSRLPDPGSVLLRLPSKGSRSISGRRYAAAGSFVRFFLTALRRWLSRAQAHGSTSW